MRKISNYLSLYPITLHHIHATSHQAHTSHHTRHASHHTRHASNHTKHASHHTRHMPHHTNHTLHHTRHKTYYQQRNGFRPPRGLYTSHYHQTRSEPMQGYVQQFPFIKFHRSRLAYIRVKQSKIPLQWDVPQRTLTPFDAFALPKAIANLNSAYKPSCMYEIQLWKVSSQSDKYVGGSYATHTTYRQ